MHELSIISAFSSALLAGVFFTFSSFVMSALGNIDSPEGIRAMQRINIDVFSWSFSLLFFAVPVFVFILGIYAVMNWSEPVSSYYLLGSIVYLLGSLTVTAAANVPLNNTLARLNPDSKNATAVWRDYILTWTRWNHLRTMACLLASILFAAAAYLS